MLTWILVRTLWAFDRWQVVYFFLALLLSAGASVWVRSGGDVGAYDGMVAGAMSRVGVSSSPGLFVGGEGAL